MEFHFIVANTSTGVIDRVMSYKLIVPLSSRPTSSSLQGLNMNSGKWKYRPTLFGCKLSYRRGILVYASKVRGR